MPPLSRVKIALVLVILASGCTAYQSTTVVDVADGDTIDVRFNGTVETVRFIGVDTPETTSKVNPEEFNVSDTEEDRECLSNWASKASEKTKRLNGEQIRLVHNGERGYYGRLLGYIYLENRSRSYNYMLVKKGYARVYDSKFSKRALFLDAQRTARQNEAGFWSCD